MRAPRLTSSHATCQQPYPTALASGMPPAMDPKGFEAGTAVDQAAATSASSLLAAPCSGVSAKPTIRGPPSRNRDRRRR
jgi:hypothetical protein